MAQRTDLESGVRPEEAEALLAANGAGSGTNENEGPRTAPRSKLPIILAVVGLAVAALLVWRHYANWVSTDDAEIEGHIDPISARVSGHVVRVLVDNTQFVNKGTVLAQLDPTDYQVAVAHAQARLANARAAAEAAEVGVPITSINTLSQVHSASAGVQSAQAGIEAAEKQFQAAQARLLAAEADNVKAQLDLKRYQELVGKAEISRQQYDQAVAAAKSSAAAVTADEASAAAAEQQVTQARSRLADAEAKLRFAQTRPQQLREIRARADAAMAAVQEADATLHQAELNLQYTTIVAPISGIIGNRTVVDGQNVQPGQALMAIVPTEDIWVTANFKETALHHMRVGQPVKIHVDAYGRDYTGHLIGIAGATGVQFSLLPPENATGNYVKVVQRVPVRIVFDKGQDPNHLLKVGLSVEPHVKIN